MLVAFAVLALILVLLGQILTTVSGAWTAGQKKANNFAKARAMLDMFARDVQGGVFRPDLAAFPGGTISFYTKLPGVSSNGATVRRISLVKYSYSTNQATSAGMSTLQRGDTAIPWSAGAEAVPFGNTTDFGTQTPSPRDTAPGVVAYQTLFVYADGTTSSNYPNGTNALRALALTLAVVDDKTLDQLSTNQVQHLRDGFNASTGGANGVRAAWEKYLATGSGPGWSSYPKSLGSNLKVFERYVLLPNL
ncbi:hypothetical protein BH09VER1_BH09VER1_17500 [soil metagenome]